MSSMLETTDAYKVTSHEDYHIRNTTTSDDKDSHSGGKHNIPPNLALFYARYPLLTAITSEPGLRFPEGSVAVRTWPGADYMYYNAPAHSVKKDMDNSLPPGAGVPPISSRRQPQTQTNQFAQSQPPTQFSMAPQNLYPAPHQDAPGSRYGPSDVPSALVISSPPYPSPPSHSHHAGYAMSQYPLPHTHAPPYTVPPSPPLVFPRHPGSPGGEASMQHLAYASRSMMSMLQQPYQRRSTDPTPSPQRTYAASPPITTMPIYPHVPVTPPPSSPLASRKASNASSSEALHSTTYSSVGYATPPPFVYPTPFVLPHSIYGTHYASPHYVQPYGSPPKQDSQRGWWYPPPGATTAGISFREPHLRSQSHSDHPSSVSQHANEQSASPTPSLGLIGKYPPGSRLGSSSDTRADTAPASTHITPSSTSESQTKTEDTPSREGGHNSLQERRSYHPKTPANRSEWVLWAGNVPSDATTDELRDFFNQPPPSPGQSGSSMKPQEVFGGVSSVFLIARSNCAFINFESEAHLEAATARFHGEPIRPDDLRCPRLVCRVRKRTDDLRAGVGAQRGSSMHVKWIREQRERAGSHGIDSKALSLTIQGSSSPLSISDDEGQGGSSSPYSSYSASTTSDILSRYFPQRYFILKSLTQHDLDLSVQRNIWATQPHNEEILDQAYRTSKDVFLIFSVNKSGEFYGYARMAGPVQKCEDRVPWASRSPTPASTPVSRVPMASEVPGNSPPLLSKDAVKGYQVPHSLSLSEEHRAVEQSPKFDLHPPEGPSSTRVQASSAPADLDGFHCGVPHSAQMSSAGPPHASIPLKSLSLELDADAPYRAMRATSEQSIHVETHPALSSSLGEHGVSERARDVALHPVAEEPAKDGDEAKDISEVWGRPFRVEWIRMTHLPFFRTHHLRNPWNHGREVKVSRDGTELEPDIGRQLLEEWNNSPASPADVPSSTTQRRRGPKSTQHAP